MRRTSTAILAAASMLAATPAAAQQAEGHWRGTLQVSQQTTLRVGVSIERGAEGALTGTLDSPDQNAFDFPLAEIAASDAELSFTLPSIAARFQGAWNAGIGGWEGTWQQGGASLPLVLTPGEPFQPPALPADWAIPGDEAIASLIDTRIAQRPGAGMVVGVVEPGGQRIVARGPAGGAAFDGETLFEIGSMTKVFTALLLADMVLKGEVSLDDPAATYLPEGATMPGRNGREITLKNLTMQDSGLPRLPGNMRFGDPQDPYADYTEADLLAFLSQYELPRDVGSQYEYSNLGVGLLGYLLGRAAGSDYETLLRERILAPLGMSDTGVALSAGQEQRLAPAFDAYMRPTKPWHIPALAGAGALRSTASDMLRFLEAALDPTSLIGPAMRLTVSERRPMGNGIDTALGWMVTDRPSGEVLMHGGGTGGFRSFMAVQPEKDRAVLVLTNSAVEPSAEDIGLHLLSGSTVANALPIQQPPAERAEREEVTLSAEELERLVGTYQLAPGVQIILKREEAGLTAQVTGQPPFPIFASGPLDFFWRVADAQIRFVEEDGAITGAVLRQNGRDIPARRIEQ